MKKKDKYFLTTLGRDGPDTLGEVFKEAGIRSVLPKRLKNAFVGEVRLTRGQADKLQGTGHVWLAKITYGDLNL